jgi:hypothetical protein
MWNDPTLALAVTRILNAFQNYSGKACSIVGFPH